MAKYEPSDPQVREAYKKTLSPNLHPCFDALAKLIDDRKETLDSYYQVGVLARRLRAEGGADGRELAKALGPRVELLDKAMQFVELYPNPKDVEELMHEGVQWSFVKLAFPIKDPKKRRAMLLNAKKLGWTIEEFRSQLRQRHPTKRRGIGGRKRRSREDLNPQSALDQLITAGGALLHLYDDVWEQKDQEHRASLRDLIRQSEDAKRLLGKIKAACQNLIR